MPNLQATSYFLCVFCLEDIVQKNGDKKKDVGWTGYTKAKGTSRPNLQLVLAWITAARAGQQGLVAPR